MAAQTKAQRSAAAKKGARTRAKSGGEATRRAATKSSELPPLTVVRGGRVPPSDDPTNGRGVPNPPNEKHDGTDISKLKKLGSEDFEVVQLDGANAVVRLGKAEFLVDQADLVVIGKRVSKGVQVTY